MFKILTSEVKNTYIKPETEKDRKWNNKLFFLNFLSYKKYKPNKIININEVFPRFSKPE